MARLEVKLVGGVQLRHDEVEVGERLLRGRHVRLLLAVLVVERHRPVTTDHLGEILWHTGRPRTWRTAVRGLVQQLRDTADMLGLDRDQTITSVEGAYQWTVPETVVDLEQVEAMLEQASELLVEDTETARDLVNRARAISSRPLLPGVETPWLDEQRSLLGRQHVRALELLGRARASTGQVDAAIAVVEEALQLDPFREPAWRQLMRLHAQAGDVGGALRAYEECRRLLGEELGADPSPATQHLHLELLRGTPDPIEPAATTGARSELAMRDANATLDGSPYPGLRAYQQQDAARFFGRGAEVQELVTRLEHHRLVAVVGPSGSGKSSLVRAGLLPALSSGAIADADLWTTVVTVPGPHPLKSLGRELTELDGGEQLEQYAARLGDHEDALHRCATAALAAAGAGARLLVVIDQFEELFTQCTDPAEREAYVAALLHATRTSGSRTSVVITLRADFYADAARVPELAEALSNSQVVVTPLDGEGLQLAIEGPARLHGLELEAGLVGRILSDVAGRAGVLPLLQHALLEMYEHRAGDMLTLADHDAVGGVAGALAQRAEAVYRGLGGQQQRLARRILLRLVEPGTEAGTATRRRAAWAELVSDPASATDAHAVVDELVEARLLTTSADPETGQRVVEVTHEALIDGWPRLAGWVDESRAELLAQRRVTAAAEEWLAHDRDPAFLLAGSRLRQAEAWLASDDAASTPRERELVETSLARETGRRRRRRRLGIAAVAVLLVAATVSTVSALVATRNQQTATEQRDVADSRALAAAATAQLEADPELAILLAREAYERSPTYEAVASLRAGLARSLLRARGGTAADDNRVALDPSGELVASGSRQGTVALYDATSLELVAELDDPALSDAPDVARKTDRVAFSPDGQRVASAHFDGRVRIWGRDGQLQHRLGAEDPQLRNGFVGWLPDGRLVTAGGTTGTGLWDADTGEQLVRVELPGGRARGLESSGAGQVAHLDVEAARLVLQDQVGTQVVDLEAGTVVASHPQPDDQDAQLLAASVEHGVAVIDLPASQRVLLWTWEDDRTVELPVAEHLAGPVPATVATVSPAGDLVATGHESGHVALWRRDGTVVRTTAPRESAIRVVAFDPAGARLASVGSTVHVDDVETGRTVAVLSGHRQVVEDLVFHAPGSITTASDELRRFVLSAVPGDVVPVHEARVRSLVQVDDAVFTTGAPPDPTVRRTDLTSGRSTVLLTVPDHQLTLSVSPDGDLLAVTAQNVTARPPEPVPVRLLRPDGTVVHKVPVPTDDPLGLGTCDLYGCVAFHSAFSPGGRRLAIGYADGLVRIVDVGSGAFASELEVGQEAFGVGWAPVGSTVAVATADGPVHLLDATTGDADAVFAQDLPPLVLGSQNPVFGHDGAVVVTAHRDGAARLWSTSDGSLLGEYRGTGLLVSAALSDDGTFLAAGVGDRVLVWDVASGQLLTQLEGHRAQVGPVRFGTDSRTLLSGSADGTVRVWQCDVCSPVDELLALADRRVTRDLTPSERQRHLPER